MNGYQLTREWFNFCFENPEKIKPVHTALYCFGVEHCNRLGWKEKFSLPTEMAKDAIGVRSYNTYIGAFNDLVNWGFFILVEKSKNQYSSNIIALSKFDKATDKALDKALIKHSTEHSESTEQSIDSINKQYNHLNQKQKTGSLSSGKRIINLPPTRFQKPDDQQEEVEEIVDEPREEKKLTLHPYLEKFCEYFNLPDSPIFYRPRVTANHHLNKIEESGQMDYFKKQTEYYFRFKELTGQEICNWQTWFEGNSEKRIPHWTMFDYEAKYLTTSSKQDHNKANGAFDKQIGRRNR